MQTKQKNIYIQLTFAFLKKGCFSNSIAVGLKQKETMTLKIKGHIMIMNVSKLILNYVIAFNP